MQLHHPSTIYLHVYIILTCTVQGLSQGIAPLPHSVPIKELYYCTHDQKAICNWKEKQPIRKRNMAMALFEDEKTCPAPEKSGKESFDACFHLPSHKLTIATLIFVST